MHLDHALERRDAVDRSAAPPRCAWRHRRIVESTAASTGSLTRTTGATPARCTVRFACTVPRAERLGGARAQRRLDRVPAGRQAQPQLQPLGVDGFEFPGPRHRARIRRRPARSRSCSTAPSTTAIRELSQSQVRATLAARSRPVTRPRTPALLRLGACAFCLAFLAGRGAGAGCGGRRRRRAGRRLGERHRAIRRALESGESAARTARSLATFC